MLGTRVLTALALLVVLSLVLYSGSHELFLVASAVVLALAIWESARLFHASRPVFAALVWTVLFLILVLQGAEHQGVLLFVLCAAIWAIRFVPALGLGLPSLGSVGNRLLQGLYNIAVVGCFVAIVVLFQHSPAYLISVLAIVWVADIGAYFAGKSFGRRKLAPSISPGKSWEGAVGGWLLVLMLGAACVDFQPLGETFAPLAQARFGWGGYALLMTLLVAASIIGDLFESMLKRRAGVKDSSALLPGHGGILDRIDALIPTLPLAVLVGFWL